jgi:hypothetical protein
MPRRSYRLQQLDAKKNPHKYFIKHRPTVLDELPHDVIRSFIFPCLDYNSRINLNLCLPTWDRIPTKMNKQSVDKFDKEIRTKVISDQLTRQQSIPSRDSNNRIIITTHIFETLRCPLFFRLIKEHLPFKTTVVAKIDELLHDMRNLRVDVKVKRKFTSETLALRKMINKNGPYNQSRTYFGVPSLSFN